MLQRFKFSACFCFCILLFNICSAQTPNLVLPLEHSSVFFSTLFSPDGKKIAVTSWSNNTPKILSPSSRNPFIILKGHTQAATSAEFSPDCKKIVTTSLDSTARIWDTETGSLLGILKGHTRGVVYADFSRDGKRIVTASDDGTVKVWEWDGMKWSTIMTVLKNSNVQAYSACFNPDGTKIVTGSADDTAKIWDVATGHLDGKLIGHSSGYAGVMSVKFSTDGTKIVSASFDGTATIWNVKTGKPMIRLLGHKKAIYTVQFSWDGKQLITASNDGTAKIWEAATGKFLRDIIGHTDEVKSARFSPDGKRIITSSYDHTIKVWDPVTAECLYTFYAVDSSDYLVVDKESRYDGTEAARKLLYFTCGKDTIDLAQVKDDLWQPGLSDRINRGENINTKTLSELNICGLAPEVEAASNDSGDYSFQIKPRRGKLGATELFINGILLSTYQPGDLTKTGSTYELLIRKEKLAPHLPGAINNMSVIAYTDADHSSVSSREVSVTINKTGPPAPPPNLYAVMVGVSDYKGTDMDLDYAAIDATDISAVVADAAKKWLGADHVFMYNLTTAGDRYQFPDKESIKKVFENIGKNAAANDILLIFLSGHGVMGEKNKQFYYMTADASTMADESVFPDVGISTSELTDWINPENIKAQKRILILDACHSGQAINNFVSLGNAKQGFKSAKSDEKSQEIKAIDKLNEKSGLFILSASSSDQRAWESGIYSHGFLTYSLLKAIKQQPDILNDGKFLNVSRWLNAAGKTVSELAKQDGSKQEPQIITTTDFDIGIVDEELMTKINLAETKPSFTSGNFLNADMTIADDDLDLRKLVDKAMEKMSGAGIEDKIFYSPSANAADAYSLAGIYTVKENKITAQVKIKQNKIIKHQFEIIGTKDKLDQLAERIAEKAAELAESDKEKK